MDHKVQRKIYVTRAVCYQMLMLLSRCSRLAGSALDGHGAAHLAGDDRFLPAQVDEGDGRAGRAGDGARLSLHLLRLAVPPALLQLRGCLR